MTAEDIIANGRLITQSQIDSILLKDLLLSHNYTSLGL
jgi:hypothetical protein